MHVLDILTKMARLQVTRRHRHRHRHHHPRIPPPPPPHPHAHPPAPGGAPRLEAVDADRGAQAARVDRHLRQAPDPHRLRAHPRRRRGQVRGGRVDLEPDGPGAPRGEGAVHRGRREGGARDPRRQDAGGGGTALVRGASVHRDRGARERAQVQAAARGVARQPALARDGQRAQVDRPRALHRQPGLRADQRRGEAPAALLRQLSLQHDDGEAAARLADEVVERVHAALRRGRDVLGAPAAGRRRRGRHAAPAADLALSRRVGELLRADGHPAAHPDVRPPAAQGRRRLPLGVRPRAGALAHGARHAAVRRRAARARAPRGRAGGRRRDGGGVEVRVCRHVPDLRQAQVRAQPQASRRRTTSRRPSRSTRCASSLRATCASPMSTRRRTRMAKDESLLGAAGSRPADL